MSRHASTAAARLAVALLLAAPLVGVPWLPAQAAVTISWSQRASGFDQPTLVTSPRDGTGRMFVVEKAGVVRVVRGGTVQARPYLDIRSRVRDVGEGGLLSIAFHPHWKTHPFIWAAYTNNAGDVRLARFRATSYRADHARRSSEKHLLTVPHPARFTNHFAGQLVFGTGGYLFMSTGDGGGGGDPFNHGQSKKTLQGKLLRIQVLGARKACGHYACTPRSNPFAGPKKGRGLIWAVGLRNAWRFSVDPATGVLWVADVGQDRVEEVDRVARGGLNLGWSCREGNRVYDGSRCKATRRYHGPVWTYIHSYGNSITGGFIYRGSRFAALLGGRYIGGDFGSGKVFYSSGTRLVTAGSLGGVTSFGEDQGRELWAVTIGGGLYQMTAG